MRGVTHGRDLHLDILAAGASGLSTSSPLLKRFVAHKMLSIPVSIRLVSPPLPRSSLPPPLAGLPAPMIQLRAERASAGAGEHLTVSLVDERYASYAGAPLASARCLVKRAVVPLANAPSVGSSAATQAGPPPPATGKRSRAAASASGSADAAPTIVTCVQPAVDLTETAAQYGGLLSEADIARVFAVGAATTTSTSAVFGSVLRVNWRPVDVACKHTVWFGLTCDDTVAVAVVDILALVRLRIPPSAQDDLSVAHRLSAPPPGGLRAERRVRVAGHTLLTWRGEPGSLARKPSFIAPLLAVARDSAREAARELDALCLAPPPSDIPEGLVAAAAPLPAGPRVRAPEAQKLMEQNDAPGVIDLSGDTSSVEEAVDVAAAPPRSMAVAAPLASSPPSAQAPPLPPAPPPTSIAEVINAFEPLVVDVAGLHPAVRRLSSLVSAAPTASAADGTTSERLGVKPFQLQAINCE